MSAKRPAVVGFTLEGARQVLQEAGVGIERVVTTGPPSDAARVPAGGLRVVQQQSAAAGRVKLVVAREIRLEARDTRA